MSNGNAWQVIQWFDTEPEGVKALMVQLVEFGTVGGVFDNASISELLEKHCPIEVTKNDIDTLIDDFNERLIMFH